jgi:hypothetical protein
VRIETVDQVSFYCAIDQIGWLKSLIMSFEGCVCSKSSDPCGISSFRYREKKLIKFCDLNHKIRKHCVYLKISVPDWSEKELICNRIGKTCSDDDLICPKHRYKFGIHFKSSASCHHPKHTKNNGKVKTTACSEYQARMISQKYGIDIPMGVSICHKCRTRFYKPDVEEMNYDEGHQDDDDFFCVTRSSTEEREKFNDLLGQLVPAAISPIRYQIRTPIEDLSQDMKNKLKRKLFNVTRAIQESVASQMAPGQEDDLLALLQPPELDRRIPEAPIDENLISAVKSTPKREIQAILMSTVAKTATIANIIRTFGCSKRLAYLAKRISDHNEDDMNEVLNPTQSIRRKIDKMEVQRFIDFLFNTELLRSMAYGSSNIIMSNGSKFEISKAQRTAKKEHIVMAYQEHSENIGLSTPSRSTLLKMLKCCKADQMKAIQCMDNFTAAGTSGFDKLTKIIKDSNENSDMKTKVGTFFKLNFHVKNYTFP